MDSKQESLRQELASLQEELNDNVAEIVKAERYHDGSYISELYDEQFVIKQQIERVKRFLD